MLFLERRDAFSLRGTNVSNTKCSVFVLVSRCGLDLTLLVPKISRFQLSFFEKIWLKSVCSDERHEFYRHSLCWVAQFPIMSDSCRIFFLCCSCFRMGYRICARPCVSAVANPLTTMARILLNHSLLKLLLAVCPISQLQQQEKFLLQVQMKVAMFSICLHYYAL